MSCNKSNCVIALGLTIMDRCPECEKIENAAKEEERIARNAAFASKWSRDYAEMGRVSNNKRPPYVQQTEDAVDSGDIHAIDNGPSGESAKSVASFARTIQRLKTKELASYGHGEPSTSEQEIDNPDAVFFVSCTEDEGEHRRLMLLGPYDTHAEALRNVDRGRKLAEHDPKAHWYYFGTCSMAKGTEVKGVFGK